MKGCRFKIMINKVAWFAYSLSYRYFVNPVYIFPSQEIVNDYRNSFIGTKIAINILIIFNFVEVEIFCFNTEGDKGEKP